MGQHILQAYSFVDTLRQLRELLELRGSAGEACVELQLFARARRCAAKWTGFSHSVIAVMIADSCSIRSGSLRRSRGARGRPTPSLSEQFEVRHLVRRE